MSAERVRRAIRGEDGFAIVTTMIVSSVMMLFTIGMLATGLHLNNMTSRDKRWNTALAVAEAGVDRAVYELEKDETYLGTGGGVLTVPGGEVEIYVDKPADGEIIVYATSWVPTRTAANRLSRRIEASFAPEDVFKYALFSETGLYVKNNGGIIGDVFANEGVKVDNNALVYGSVISATEGVEVSSNAIVFDPDGTSGNLYSGGPAGILVDTNAIVEGGAYAQATACSGSAPAGQYGVTAVGTVTREAVAWGSISGNVLGARTPNNCQLAPTTKNLPRFTWDPSLYTGEVEYTTVSAFQSFVDANLNNLTGIHHVWVDDCASDPSGSTPIEMGGATVTSDFVLVTNCRIDMNLNFTVNAPVEALVDIIVLNTSADPAAILIKNNFDVLSDTAVLLYATGLIEVKNNPGQNGAVYAGAISIKNNLDITYDPRVERTLGFGDVKYDRVSWIECQVGTTGTNC